MSQEIQESVYKQQEIIKDKQMKVKEDLDMVEPAVLEAQNGKCPATNIIRSTAWNGLAQCL